MTIYLIIFILATLGLAIVFNTELKKNKLLKFGSIGLYFLLIEVLLYVVTDDITIPVILLGIILLVALLVAAVGASFWASKQSAILKYIFSTVFLVAVFGISFILFESIMEPIRFDKEKEKRYVSTVKELLVIKKVQILFKKEKGNYTSNFDELRTFMENDSLTIVKKEGEIHDSIYLEAGNNMAKAEKIALKYKLIIRDTIRVSVKDSLFRDYNISRLGYVPHIKDVLFDMDTATIEVGGININLFEAKVANLSVLNGLDNQLILNLDDKAVEYKKYRGIKIGSITENNNNEGNWDKEIEVKILKQK